MGAYLTFTLSTCVVHPSDPLVIKKFVRYIAKYIINILQINVSCLSQYKFLLYRLLGYSDEEAKSIKKKNEKRKTFNDQYNYKNSIWAP